uniref:NADH:ubiquinone reductase (H(+)-translocating) n=1 Tax=Salpa fusiformis TaxID=942554 RepID=A0A2Z5UF93_9UROC|nr:NADH dehydrogenase subunit 5 [Salpa fusiformis]
MLFGLSYTSKFILSVNFDLLSLSVMLSVSLVIALLSVFIPWYMHSEPKMYQFYLLIGVFTISILFLSITQVGLMFLIFWEILGISSYLLVSWWKGRDLANSLALVGLLSSRIGDICLFLVVLGSNNFENFMISFLILMGFSSKSAQFVFFPWLLGAMEGPGPVSALLHSSTLVLAGVILGFRMKDMGIGSGLLISGMGGIILGVVGTSMFVDLKKRVACSTVYNVGFMFLWIYLGEYGILYVHMVFHAVIKASTFVLLGVAAHLLNMQDIRAFLGYTHKQMFSLFIMLLAMLSMLPLVGVLSFKESGVEMLGDNGINIWLFVSLLVVSCLGFIFFIEYVLLLSKQNISNTKFIPFPSYIHGSLLSKMGLVIVIFYFMIEMDFGNISIFTNYPMLLGISLIYAMYMAGRNSFLDMQYVSKYNSTVMGNINSFKKQLIGLEFFLMVLVPLKLEGEGFKMWSHNSKLSYSILFSLMMIIVGVLYTFSM